MLRRDAKDLHAISPHEWKLGKVVEYSIEETAGKPLFGQAIISGQVCITMDLLIRVWNRKWIEQY
jgi:hypothetical protein